MTDIFKESDRLLRESRRMDDSIVSIPCSLRLFHSTGLRITEAMSDRNEYMDSKLNGIKIGDFTDTKNCEEHYVIICDSLRKLMV